MYRLAELVFFSVSTRGIYLLIFLKVSKSLNLLTHVTLPSGQNRQKSTL